MFDVFQAAIFRFPGLVWAFGTHIGGSFFALFRLIESSGTLFLEFELLFPQIVDFGGRRVFAKRSQFGLWSFVSWFCEVFLVLREALCIADDREKYGGRRNHSDSIMRRTECIRFRLADFVRDSMMKKSPELERPWMRWF
jgi:hypothetical protein